MTRSINWDKIFKNGPSKICEKQPLKNLKGYSLIYRVPSKFLKTVFQEFHLVLSWIFCPKCPKRCWINCILLTSSVFRMSISWIYWNIVLYSNQLISSSMFQCKACVANKIDWSCILMADQQVKDLRQHYLHK